MKKIYFILFECSVRINSAGCVWIHGASIVTGLEAISCEWPELLYRQVEPPVKIILTSS